MKYIPSSYKIAKDIRAFGRVRKGFLNQPWASGLVLLLCVILAMLLANLPFTKHIYHEFLLTELTIHVQSPDGHIDCFLPQGMTVEKFINDVLMVIFFFTVGLEIKREVVCGELSSPKKAMMPVIAAAGGMLFPALIYTIVNHGTASGTGWGIPTATDIAFAIGIMTVLGSRVPLSLKVFLTALAIADDLGAILVVAFFYGGAIDMQLLFIAIAVLAVLFLMNRLGEKRMRFYILPGIAVWFLFYYAGIHATMSGVALAFMIPMDARYTRSYFERRTREYERRITQYDSVDIDAVNTFPNSLQRHCLRRMSYVSKNSMGMSFRLEHMLSNWVSFCIMPVFALANAGVEIPDSSYFNIFQWTPEAGSVGMGVFFGLLLGKPLGIVIASAIAIRLGIGEMPQNATWKMTFAVACLGGIGFTMSIFVDTLSFADVPELTEQLRASGKIAILIGSLSAGILGSTLIALFHKQENKKTSSLS